MDLEELLKLPREELLRELKKYPPEERIKKLKELDEARKKEEEETHKLMEDTIKEINTEKDTVQNDSEQEPVDAGNKTKELSLEEEIEKTPPPEISNIPPSYQEAFEKVSGLYTQLREIVQDEEPSSGYSSLYRAEEIYNEIINHERYQPQENIKDIAYSSRKLMKELRGEYISQFYKD
ncbi:MAG: hypothetical protein ACOCZ6_01820 [Nanoarchaeota archaeon]